LYLCAFVVRPVQSLGVVLCELLYKILIRSDWYPRPSAKSAIPVSEPRLCVNPCTDRIICGSTTGRSILGSTSASSCKNSDPVSFGGRGLRPTFLQALPVGDGIHQHGAEDAEGHLVIEIEIPAIVIENPAESLDRQAAPKYWNASITPDANAAILRPPMSIAAAGPSSECVEFTVKAISTKNTSAQLTDVTWAART
jgi:hypothetical protein